MRSSLSQHSVLCRDSGARCCVPTKRDARTTETRVRQKYSVTTKIPLSRQTSYNGKKKKKKYPQDWGATFSFTFLESTVN